MHREPTDQEMTYYHARDAKEGVARLERKIDRFLAGMPTRPTIVCLCGSTRFYKEFLEQNYQETMRGHIVLSVGFYPHAVAEMHGEGVGITPAQKEELDQLHLRKVEMCDEVLVLNVGQYIGASTARELAYARMLGKTIRFLEAEQCTTN